MTQDEARELASQFGTRMCDENGDTHGEELYCFDLDDIIAIKEALAEHAMQEVQRLGQEIEQKIGCVNHDCEQCKAQPEQEPMAWRNAAIRVGEDLSSVGPDGYYDMTAQQWLDWAMAQEPRGKNSLAQEQEPVAWMDADGNVSDNNDHKCFPIPLYTKEQP